MMTATCSRKVGRAGWGKISGSLSSGMVISRFGNDLYSSVCDFARSFERN